MVAFSLVFSGCSRAPSVSILGAFFPAWIICCVVGIVLAVLTYYFFKSIDFATVIALPALTFPCLAVLYTFITWIIFYS